MFGAMILLSAYVARAYGCITLSACVASTYGDLFGLGSFRVFGSWGGSPAERLPMNRDKLRLNTGGPPVAGDSFWVRFVFFCGAPVREETRGMVNWVRFAHLGVCAGGETVGVR